MEWFYIILWCCVTVNGVSDYQQVGLMTDQKGKIIIATGNLNVKLQAIEDFRKEEVLLISEDSVYYSLEIHNVRKGEFIMFLSELKKEEKFKSVNSYIISNARCK